MKTINFNAKSPNLFHTKKEFDIQAESNVLKGKATITGHTKETIDVGDLLDIVGTKYEVTAINERRNHAGEFTNPEDKIDSFFSVETKFERLVVLK
jgi:hypothetical protein